MRIAVAARGVLMAVLLSLVSAPALAVDLKKDSVPDAGVAKVTPPLSADKLQPPNPSPPDAGSGTKSGAGTTQDAKTKKTKFPY